ncbi:MAG: hypothetical protein ACFB4J_01480 [Elainellaceae cyanobacterium]
MTTPQSSPEDKRVEQRKQNLQKLFLILLAIGLVLGGLLAIGVIQLMIRFGLTESQPQFEPFRTDTPEAIAPQPVTQKVTHPSKDPPTGSV